MTTTILNTASSTGPTGISSGDDGTLTIKTGITAGSQVNALTFAADGTPTFLKYVTGSTIQTIMSTDAGTAGLTATSLTNVSVAIQSITPKSTNSKILIRCTFLAYIAPLASNNVQGAISLYDSTNAALIGNQITFGPNSGSGGVGGFANQTIEYFVSNTALTSRSFTLRAATGTASAPISCTACVWTLTEVQN